MLHRSSPDIVLYSLALACPCFLPFMLFVPCKVEMPVTDEAADLEGDEEAMEFTERFGCIQC